MASDATEMREGVISAEQALTFLDEASAILAGTLEYEATLGQIAQLLVPIFADWCKVDVVDDDGTLRTISSGHPDPEQERLLETLRDRYREERGANEGVLRVLQTGEPELFADVTGLDNARLQILPEEREAYERLSPKSYLIVPMTARGRTLGAITLLSTRPGRHYGPADVGFAQHLARRFALAVDNARLYEQAENSRALLDNLFTSAPVGIAMLDAQQRFLRINPALAAMNGAPVEAHIGRTLGEVIGAPGEATRPFMDRVISNGESLTDLEVAGDDLGLADGRHFLASYTPIRASDGEIIGASAVVLDITDRRRALDAEREAARRARFLAEAGALLDASMDHEQVLQNVADQAVPGFADWCAVSLLDEDANLVQLAVSHADPEKVRWARELAQRYPPVVDPDIGVGKVLATGEPDVVNDISDELLAQVAIDAEHHTILKELGLRAAVTVPLVARGRILGSMSFVAAESGRRYGEADVQLFAELGRRAGVAVENSRLYTERSRIAHTLQARLLPSRLPAPPGVQLAARYRAAGEFNEVGGDFYDAFQRAPEEWVVVIGDVSGKGPEAAALTALARYTIRSAALNDWTPAHVLRRLNDTLLHEEESQFVTVALAYLRPEGDGVGLRLVLGGHPPPCIVRADGSAETVGEPGTLLGIRTDVRLHEVEARMAPGDALLLYTDGVIEAGPRGAPLGEDGLLALLAKLGSSDPDLLVSAVDAAALEAGPGRSRDDVALLAIQAVSRKAPREGIELTRPASAEHLRELREAAVGYAQEVAGIDLAAVRLAVGEACANAVVHAYRDVTGAGPIQLRALATDAGLVVEVRDEGCGPTPRSDSPGLGLGLPLMARLTRELQVLDREPHGTLVRLTF